MSLKGKQIGFALPECHFSMESILTEIRKIVAQGAEVFPLFLESGDQPLADSQIRKNCQLVEEITGRELLTVSLADETNLESEVDFDLLVVAPCPGNFLSKLLNARSTAVPLNKTIRHLETGRPVVLALVPNGDSENLLQNVTQIIHLKSIYLVPFAPVESGGGKQIFLSRLDLLYDTVVYALAHKQIQPVYIETCWLPH